MTPFLQRIYNGSIPEMDAFVNELKATIPLLGELMNTMQDEEWHAEGDVHTHTDMVLDELRDLLADDISWLDDERRFCLVMAATLHDIAKPITSRVVERHGRTCIISPNHEEKGRSSLVPQLLQLEIRPELVLEIVNLVGYHQMPGRLVRNDAADSAYFRLARQVDVQLLYYLELADMRGRICDDHDKNIEVLNLFRMRLEELNLWENDEPYEDWLMFFEEHAKSSFKESFSLAVYDFENGKINSPEEGLARSYSLKDGFPELILTCGPSGSGKSSWLKSLDESWKIISLDELRFELTGTYQNQKENGAVLQAAKETLKQHLRQKKKIVWDATSLRKDHRSALIKLAMDYGALLTIRCYIVSSSELYKRNKKRQKPIPEKVLDKQLTALQFPELNEAHRVEVINADNQSLMSSP
ncbi:MAG: AAA family ATPase [Lentisphaerales bacterium]|nr:AAA family ATPase [Lentisphaerales bacterium]